VLLITTLFVVIYIPLFLDLLIIVTAVSYGAKLEGPKSTALLSRDEAYELNLFHICLELMV
jgi:hypothetical protein